MARYFMSRTPLADLNRKMMTPSDSGCWKVDRELDVRRGYSRHQVEGTGFPIHEYKFPQGKGAFVGELVMKKRGKRNPLICYFDAPAVTTLNNDLRSLQTVVGAESNW